MQEPLLAGKVLVVVVLEHGGGLQVQRRQVVVALPRRAGAARLPGAREPAVDVGVVVDVGSEVGAACLPDGVSTCKRSSIGLFPCCETSGCRS